MNKECVTCELMGKCTITNSQKVMEHFCCEQFSEVRHPVVIQVRCDIINKFGSEGLKALLSPPIDEED